MAPQSPTGSWLLGQPRLVTESPLLGSVSGCELVKWRVSDGREGPTHLLTTRRLIPQAASSAAPLARAAESLQTQAPLPLLAHLPHSEPQVSCLWPTVQQAGLAGWESVGGEDLAHGKG